ncbi:MAG TPA: hypothetical protein VG096_26615 [Bryobacteraceae bacterium]|jgi:hypothetical protein|nr:hypothetical protein [Bryobacteraceae bacterium]
MQHEDFHLSDQQILQDIDGELSTHEEKLVRAHLGECWKCRARRQELESAIGDFVRMHQQEFDAKLPPAAGPRALLKAQIAGLAATPNRNARRFAPPRRVAWELAAAICGVLVIGVFLALSGIGRQSQPHAHAVVISIPDSTLTPGATLLVSRRAVCSQENTKNKPVPTLVQRKVFEEYGIARADPRAYEVDYLITPALGGADDIHNLWPHSNSAAVWNAPVKDALEDRLREMVCDGTLDLTEAQREIANNWIAAYKKYFHTDKPLAER